VVIRGVCRAPVRKGEERHVLFDAADRSVRRAGVRAHPGARLSVNAGGIASTQIYAIRLNPLETTQIEESIRLKGCN